ncbi:MAG: alpha-D-glucose phosphate-specific phosphoglucomutase [Gammaproteobacteria bacterium]|nr:alpha-D-glucose phosphate-specific phosphoglucomutase [Gammaproteobacteria bacterium]
MAEPRAIPVTAFRDQRPGTSGLRKPVRIFRQRDYLAAFVQSVFDVMAPCAGETLVLGGDGRYFGREAIGIIVAIAAGNGFARVLAGRGGLLSTPAAARLIVLHGARLGLLLTASHNPGGPGGDFGVKINVAGGGPAPEQVTEAVYRRSREIDCYRVLEAADIDIDREGTTMLGGTRIEIINPVADYASLMERLFDFDRLRTLLAGGRFRMRFDAMHGVTGPYAHEILERRLGAPPGTVTRGAPREDFGGDAPDPNLAHARALVSELFADDAPDLGAACDGDGDRNLILGRGHFVTPSDSLALLTANAASAPGYARALAGVARSMPTSRAVDRVARAAGIPCYETPTGWKFFANLLADGRITLCGEESFGTGSDHLPEKDGLWAVLFWLSVLAARRQPVREIAREHWARFGRDYYARHDYEALGEASARGLMQDLRRRLPRLRGQHANGFAIVAADEFTYVDPVDGSVAAGQGVRITLSPDARVVYRLSGTGTRGATLRVYLERHEPDPARQTEDAATALAAVAAAARALADIDRHTGRLAPSLVT